MSTSIVMVRHGETDWNRDRRFQGHADVPLNDVGRREVAELAEELAGESFAVAYTSPLRRAAETAAILGERLGLEVHASDALKEVDVGSWSGLTVAEVEQRFPDGFGLWAGARSAGWHDGETYEELARRVVSGLREIAERHPGSNVLAVTHGGPIRCALAAALTIPATEVHSTVGPLGNCAVVRVAVREGVLEPVS